MAVGNKKLFCAGTWICEIDVLILILSTLKLAVAALYDALAYPCPLVPETICLLRVQTCQMLFFTVELGSVAATVSIMSFMSDMVVGGNLGSRDRQFLFFPIFIIGFWCEWFDLIPSFWCPGPSDVICMNSILRKICFPLQSIQV